MPIGLSPSVFPIQEMIVPSSQLPRPSPQPPPWIPVSLTPRQTLPEPKFHPFRCSLGSDLTGYNLPLDVLETSPDCCLCTSPSSGSLRGPLKIHPMSYLCSECSSGFPVTWHYCKIVRWPSGTPMASELRPCPSPCSLYAICVAFCFP